MTSNLWLTEEGVGHIWSSSS